VRVSSVWGEASAIVIGSMMLIWAPLLFAGDSKLASTLNGGKPAFVDDRVYLAWSSSLIGSASKTGPMSETVEIPVSVDLTRSFQLAQIPAAVNAEPTATATPRFDIRSYRLDGNTLLKSSDVAEAVAPNTGKAKDFGDVQQPFTLGVGAGGVRGGANQQECVVR
jgi:hypothetical protein